MLLRTHRLIDGIAEFNRGLGPGNPFVYYDDPSSTRQRFNSNFGAIEDFVEEIEVTVEDTVAAVFGCGVITGLVPSIGAGLSIDYTQGTALIGFVISKTAGNIVVPANYNPGYVYLQQDGTFVVNNTGVKPSSVESFLFCEFVSTAGAVTSVSTTNRDPEKILPAKIRKITGSTGVMTPIWSTRDYLITHSYEIEIPGYITVSSNEPDVDVTVIDLERATPTSFWIRVSHNKAYGYDYSYYSGYYGDYSIISWERTGLGYTI